MAGLGRYTLIARGPSLAGPFVVEEEGNPVAPHGVTLGIIGGNEDPSHSAGRCISIFVDARDSGHFAFLFLAIELRGFVVRVSWKQRALHQYFC